MTKHTMGFVIIATSQALLQDSGSILLKWDWGFPNGSETGDVQMTI